MKCTEYDLSTDLDLYRAPGTDIVDITLFIKQCLGVVANVDFICFSIRLHTTSCIDCITKKAIARHF